MHWFDWMALGIVVVVAIIETVRATKAGGMGLALFDAAGVIVASVAATKLGPGLSQTLKMQPSTVVLIVFIALAILAIVLGYWLFGLTGWSFQSLDGFFSVVFGVATGWAVANMVLRIIMLSQGSNGEVASALAASPVVREIYQFKTWNALMRLLFKAKVGPDFNPDIG
jgi:hypothetical protein